MGINYGGFGRKKKRRFFLLSSYVVTGGYLRHGGLKVRRRRSFAELDKMEAVVKKKSSANWTQQST